MKAPFKLILVTFLLLLSGASSVLAQADPEVIVGQFLNNWSQQNYDGMYAEISDKSKALTTFPVFETTYRDAATAMGLESMTYTLGQTTLQGTSAAVSYDLTIESGIFGTINDPGRLMRLVQGPSGWQVAWSPMDIFDGMTSSARTARGR